MSKFPFALCKPFTNQISVNKIARRNVLNMHAHEAKNVISFNWFLIMIKINKKNDQKFFKVLCKRLQRRVYFFHGALADVEQKQTMNALYKYIWIHSELQLTLDGVAEYVV